MRNLVKERIISYYKTYKKKNPISMYHTFKVLNYIIRHRGCKVKDIIAKTKLSRRTVLYKIRLLKELNLITVKKGCKGGLFFKNPRKVQSIPTHTYKVSKSKYNNNNIYGRARYKNNQLNTTKSNIKPKFIVYKYTNLNSLNELCEKLQEFYIIKPYETYQGIIISKYMYNTIKSKFNLTKDELNYLLRRFAIWLFMNCKLDIPDKSPIRKLLLAFLRKHLSVNKLEKIAEETYKLHRKIKRNKFLMKQKRNPSDNGITLANCLDRILQKLNIN